MLGPRNIAASKMLCEASMRGEPNSVVCHFASTPSAVTLESIGSVLPLKLGLGQVERSVATNSLPACCSMNDAVPRSDTPDLNCTRALPVAGGDSGALAITNAAPWQATSLRSASRHGSHCCSVPPVGE